MTHPKQTVIVMNSDSQVLKGLVLLLEDMRFNVTSVSHQDELGTLKDYETDSPVLLLLPFEFDKGRSALELVTRLRALFKHPIPAILLNHENGLNPDQFINQDIVVLSDHTTPQNLRRNISTILNNTLTV